MSKPEKLAAPQQNAERAKVFRVESAQPYGWIVYLDGFSKTHFFVGRSLALVYAREWAKANAPSVIVMVGPDGQIEVDQTYTSIVTQCA